MILTWLGKEDDFEVVFVSDRVAKEPKKNMGIVMPWITTEESMMK